MNKIFLIIRREYLSRVKKKSFLIATILIPLLFPAIIGGIIYLAVNDESTREERVVQYYDPDGLVEPENNQRFEFVKVQGEKDSIIESFRESEDFALLIIDNPEGLNFEMHTRSSLSIPEQESIEEMIEKNIRAKNIRELELTEEEVAAINPRVDITTYNIVSEQQSSSGIAFAIGYIGGLLIYMFILLYGVQVMQGVIEEKTSKIVEILIAMVRPFQLMMGKIIGIASVGLTQFVIWIVLIGTLSSLVFSLFGLGPGSQEMEEMAAQSNSGGVEIVEMIRTIPFIPILLIFIFYFVGGYLLYGSLFAAVGSAVDNQSEASQFTFPITMPLIASIIGLSVVLNNPNGNVSFWLSVIPLTSPVSMMARIGFGIPPWWELLLSMVLLAGGFVFTTWVAGRIYRIGILASGTKVNFKVLAKWFMQKN